MMDMNKAKEVAWELGQKLGELAEDAYKQGFKDGFENQPTVKDTITMTKEEFSKRLMEHYRQGRADEKAYQNGEIMQSFNPD